VTAASDDSGGPAPVGVPTDRAAAAGDDQRPAPASRGKRPARGEPVIDRAFALLTAFDETHRRLSLAELARRSGLPSSTAHRLAERLVAFGALDRAGGGGYVIGPRLWELGALAPRGQPLVVPAGVLDTVSRATRGEVHVGVLDGDAALVVSARRGDEAAPSGHRTGDRLALHQGGLGRVLLAHAPTPVQERILQRGAGTLGTPAVWDALKLRQALADIRATGVDVVHRRSVPVVTVAVPIHGPGAAVAAALAISVVTRGADVARLTRVAVAAADGLSRDIDERPS
jgi:DNA-binding IclR family transcriptional regulator